MNSKSKSKPAPFESKTYKRTPSMPVRNPDATVFTFQLSKELRAKSRATAVELRRPEAQLWRMAYSYAESVGWKNIPVVD